jgi:UDP-N-acetylglucosamine acyltransferase
MHSIHPTATVSKECELEDGVEVGPWCTITGRVRLGKGVRLIGNVYVNGPLSIGEGTVVYPFACLGFPGQDFKFKMGDPTAGVAIGKNCIIRESATIHAATGVEKPTKVGDGVLMMAYSHVGHDATASDRTILVNSAALGGHSFLGEAAIISAGSALHQFGRVGRLAFVSASIGITLDVPPFCMVVYRGQLAGLNAVGLRRSGMPRDQITLLREAFRDAFRVFRTRDDMLKILEERGRTCPPVAEWFEFVRSKNRAITPGFNRRDQPAADEVEAS